MSELRSMPQSTEAEKAMLSCIHRAPREVFAICRTIGITAASFYVPAYELIFSALSDTWEANKPLDFITIAEELKSRDQLSKVGGPAELTEIFTFSATAANARYYAEIVQEKQALRAIITNCSDKIEAAHAADADPSEIVVKLQQESNAMLRVKSDSSKTVREVVKGIAQEVMSGEDDAGLIKTGIAAIDELLKLYRSDFLVVPGPTSSGKSALVSNIAVSMLRYGRRGAYFTLEMSAKQTLKRAIADVSGHSPEFVRKISLDQRYEFSDKVVQIQKEFMAGVEKVASFDLVMFDKIQTLGAVLSTCRALHAIKPLDFVVIDYIQLLGSGSKFATRQLELAHISKSLKLFASELDALVMTPSQVNKEGVTREAADLENDANAILTIVVKEDEGREVWIGKQREGDRNKQLNLTWNGSITKFISAL